VDKPVESQLNNDGADNAADNAADDAGGLWSSCSESIRAQVSEAVWHTTFSGAKAAALDEGELVIVVPNSLQKERIEGRYLGLVKHAINESRSDATVRVEIDTGRTEDIFDVSLIELDAAYEQIPSSETISELGTDTLPKARSESDDKFTFEHFVIGPSNRFAHAAAFSVAETPAASYNPLFIHGDSGLGKTHLLRGIANYIGSHYSHYKVRYVSTETFLNEFVQAIRTNTQPDFKRYYRTNDVLLIDDIQFMEGKEGLQEEFFHTFNSLHVAGRQIVISSDRPPRSISTLSDRLRSRFEWGLITDIQPPDLETRVAILRKKTEHGHVPDEVLEHIAHLITNNIRELEGALVRVTAYASLTRSPVTLEMAQQILSDVREPQETPITTDRILNMTADMFGYDVSELTSQRRQQGLVNARQISMYVMRELTDLSYPAIASVFGGRDHTTVMHAVKKINSLLPAERKVYDQVAQLIARVRAA